MRVILLNIVLLIAMINICNYHGIWITWAYIIAIYIYIFQYLFQIKEKGYLQFMLLHFVFSNQFSSCI